MLLAAVADDFTGANDLGGRLAGQGLKVYVSKNLETGGVKGIERAQALILNAQTRLLNASQARAGSRKAWNILGRTHGARVCFQKMDSTLRGWPGEEILGMLEATSAGHVAFCAAYPAAGRFTVRGQHFVQGKRLDSTEYFRDPLSPARTYRLARLFPQALAFELGAGDLRLGLRSGKRVLCFDAKSEADMKRIAKDCLKAGIRHFAGASGLGHAVAEALFPGQEGALPPLPKKRIVLAGSVSATSFAQLKALELSGAGKWLSADLTDSKVALSTLTDRSQLKPGRVRAEKALKDLVRRGLRRVKDPAEAFWFLTGGHTAETFYQALGLKGNWALGELMPGVALCLAERDGQKKAVLCATKPGAFGALDTLTRVMTKR